MQQADFMENNSRFVNGGKKLKSFIDRYITKSKKKDINTPLLDEIRRYLSIEKGKIEEQKLKTKLMQAVNPSTKKSKKVPKTVIDNFHREKIVIGSTVKLIETKQAGKVEEINGTIVTVAFGFLRMKVDKEKLMWIV